MFCEIAFEVPLLIKNDVGTSLEDGLKVWRGGVHLGDTRIIEVVPLLGNAILCEGEVVAHVETAFVRDHAMQVIDSVMCTRRFDVWRHIQASDWKDDDVFHFFAENYVMCFEAVEAEN